MSGASVIVANPDEQIREVVARVVESGGHSAVRLDPAAEVADAVVTSGADALVLDLGGENLPTLQALRARTEPAAGTARVVVLGTGPATSRLALHAGADAVLVRPFHARELQAAIDEALARPEPDRAGWRDQAATALADGAA